MLIFITAFKNLFDPYWDTLKKRLAKDGVAPLTIAHSSNLFGHPIGIAILLSIGMFAVPTDVKFFAYWFTMISIGSISYILTIWALLKTKFFGVQILGSLGFAANTIFAVIILGERLGFFQIIALLLATAGVILFSLPKIKGKSFVIDKGVIYIILAVIIGGFNSIIYKTATFHTPNYTSFLTGRFIGDLIGWTAVWLISLAFLKKNPVHELKNVFDKRYGFGMVLGLVASTLLSSWLIYKLPVTTVAILSTLTFPSAYFFSKKKYQEKITIAMWLGTILILGAIFVFFLL